MTENKPDCRRIDCKRPGILLQSVVTALVVLLACALTGVCGRALAQNVGTSQSTDGLNILQFASAGDSAHRVIRVWCYRPPALAADAPVVFVMHGVNRDAQRYCRDWMPYAQQYKFLLVCPEFDAADFPSRAYQRGNVLDHEGRPVPEASWTFTTIENLFDYVKGVTGNTSKGYYIYGHSAGGQFVHRFVLFMPNARYLRAIAANPGYYTMPTYSAERFPYGLSDSYLPASSLKRSFGRNFILLLGQEDLNEQDPELRQTAGAEAQGVSRFERGQHFFKIARGQAAQMGAQFSWQLKEVPGAHHSDSQMAQTAASCLFAR